MIKLMIAVLVILCAATAGNAQPVDMSGEGEPGAAPGGIPGSSSGSSGGMDEEGEPAFLRLLNQAKQKGPRSLQYIAGLLMLGMYYNRVSRYQDATRVLTQALAIVDSGAVKPSPKTAPVPPLVQHHPGGVVSATDMNPPRPYEELMENLLPALVQAEMNSGRMAQAEAHIKRMIAFAASNEVTGKINLMSAYSAYAELCRKQGRQREAAAYQKKADEINATFIGL